MKQIQIAVLILAAAISHAASAAGPVFALGDFTRSTDSADFTARSIGVGAGFHTLTDNVTDKLAYRHRQLDYTGPGFATEGSADTLLASKSFGALRADGEITRARVDSFGSRTLGAFQLSGLVPGAVNLEARFEKDLVESAPGLNQGITYSAYTLAADKEITPRFVVAGLAGRLDYSNDNQRDLFRLKAIYVVREEMGLSVYAKARHYADSHPGGLLYFSPDSFDDYLGGIQLRRRVAQLGGRFSAYIEAGRQRVDGVSSPARGWQVRLESFPNKPWHYDLAIGRQSSADAGASLPGANGNYQYEYVRAALVYPFS